MFTDSYRSWPDAKTKCEQEGYILAQPDDSVAVNLRKKLYEEYGDRSVAWLGARGDGSKFVYVHGGLALDNASPLWHPGSSGRRFGAGRCLLLIVDGPDFRDHPTRPYLNNPCSIPVYTLCEGDRSLAWLGARGDGSKFVYVHGGLALDNASPLWHPGSSGRRFGAGRCLLLIVDGPDFRDHPTRPYLNNPCSIPVYTLCEAI
ncbi:unnamed protein product [Meganyctiphanes norvegica]|uniref:C-type lectin domain-containing protein n=1 Tax=Meganyctiphanes norvegica TaxID=48144 RepID=A0AAV2SKP2_MEGNR